jgi:hypothetical protein
LRYSAGVAADSSSLAKECSGHDACQKLTLLTLDAESAY